MYCQEAIDNNMLYMLYWFTSNYAEVNTMYKLKVKEAAEAKGVNKSQLSRRADLAITTINQLWDGTRKDVRMQTLSAIAQALGVSIGDLYEEIPDSGKMDTLIHRRAAQPSVQ
jgi:DNA-binding Xre family transcriptional regulator